MLHLADPLWRKSFRTCAPEAQLIKLGVLTASSYYLETISVQCSTVWNSNLALHETVTCNHSCKTMRDPSVGYGDLWKRFHHFRAAYTTQQKCRNKRISYLGMSIILFAADSFVGRNPALVNSSGKQVSGMAAEVSSQYDT